MIGFTYEIVNWRVDFPDWVIFEYPVMILIISNKDGESRAMNARDHQE